MKNIKFLALALLASCSSLAMGQDVGVGSARFATVIEATVGERPTKLVLTGAAVRTRYFFNVYAIASYLQDGDSSRTPESLASTGAAKRLHLVMERDVSGKDMGEAFRSAIRQNYPEGQFNDEVNALVQHIQSKDVRQGDHILLTHVPMVGLHLHLVGKSEVLIRNPRFSQAVWDIYFGRYNLGDSIKRGLLSRV